MFQLTTFRVGSCRATAWAAGQAGMRPAEFPALVTLVRTPQKTVLVDCGYGPAFFAATALLPARFYRWLTPVTLPAGEHLLAQLPVLPDLVMLTHLHGDHVAGLADLPGHIPVAVSQQALTHLRGLSDWGAARAACPAMLRDMILSRRLLPIEDCEEIETGLPGFPLGRDLLGDGQLITIALPGHGTGQTGLWIPKAARLLIADAAYGRAALRTGRMPPGLVLSRLGDAGAYRRTFAALRLVMQARPDITIVPSHCPEAAP